MVGLEVGAAAVCFHGHISGGVQGVFRGCDPDLKECQRREMCIANDPNLELFDGFIFVCSEVGV